MNLVARLIRPFDPAEGPPPQAILPFMRWALRGAERAILLAFAVTFVTGISELVAARFTGWVIDQTAVVEQGAFWETFWPVVIVGVAFFLVIRPLIFVMDAGVTSILLGPNLYPMVLARLNQHTLGHSMQFFRKRFRRAFEPESASDRAGAD